MMHEFYLINPTRAFLLYANRFAFSVTNVVLTRELESEMTTITYTQNDCKISIIATFARHAAQHLKRVARYCCLDRVEVMLTGAAVLAH
jgi:hypothetical protein